MKLKILANDGSLNGWCVAFVITFTRLVLYVFNYVFPSLLPVEEKIGASFTQFTLWGVGSWFAYKVAKPLTENRNGQQNPPTP